MFRFGVRLDTVVLQEEEEEEEVRLDKEVCKYKHV
jgi:hypothetical protein